MTTTITQNPLTIKTKLGTLVITETDRGQVFIETFQKNGKRKYKMSDFIIEGQLVEVK